MSPPVGQSAGTSRRWCSGSRRAATRRPQPLVLGGVDVVSSVVSSQVDLHAEFGGVVPEVASRAHLDRPQSGRRPGDRRGWRRRVAHRRDRVHGRSRPDRGAAGRRVHGQGPGVGLGRPVRRRQPPRSAPVLGVPGGPDPRVPARRAARVRRTHRCSSRCAVTATTGCSGRRSTTPPARPSTRWPASSIWGIRAGLRSTPLRSRATRRRSISRGRCRTDRTTSRSAG